MQASSAEQQSLRRELSSAPSLDSVCQQRRHDALARQRQIADALAERARDRIADRRDRSARPPPRRARAPARSAPRSAGYRFPAPPRSAGSGSPPSVVAATLPSAKRTRSFSAKLAPWMMPPSIWFFAPSGVDHQAGIGAAPHALQAHLLVDLDLGHHGREGGDVLVAGEAEAARPSVAELGAARTSRSSRAAVSTTRRARGSESSDSR